MANFGQSRPSEACAPVTKILPDGRRRLERFYRLPHKDKIPGELAALPWGTADIGETPVEGWSAVCLLVGREVTDQPSPNKAKDTDPILHLTFEEIDPTDETRVGGPANAITKLEDGRTANVLETLQFSTNPFVPGTVGTFTAGFGYLLKVEHDDDGTLHRAKRTYVAAGTLRTDEQVKNGGKLSLLTVESAVTVPAAPSGYTLVGKPVQNPAGLPVYTYTFAKGAGEIARDLKDSLHGRVTYTTVRALGGAVAAPGEFETSVEEADGYKVYVSRGITINNADLPDEVLTRNKGKVVITRKRRINSAPTGTGSQTEARGDPQEGYTLYTGAWATGTGIVTTERRDHLNGCVTYTTVRAYGAAVAAPGEFETTTQDDDGITVYVSRGITINNADLPDVVTYDNNGLLVRTLKRRINAVPAGSGFIERDEPTRQEGYTLYERTFVTGTGEVSRRTRYDQSNDAGATGVTITTVQYITALDVAVNPIAVAGSVLLDAGFSYANGVRLWQAVYARGVGLVMDEAEFRQGNALTLFRRVQLGSVPANPSTAAGALARVIITSGGSGYTSAPTVSFTGGGGTGATATAILSGGAVTGLVLGAGGSGYTSAPTVGFTGGGGSGAAAIAALTPSTVASIAVGSGGSGYTAAPAVVLTGGAGSGAGATAVLTPTALAAIALTAPGSGYTSAPTVTITGGGGSGATASVTIAAGGVSGLTLTAPGSGYTSAPTVTFAGGGGTGAAATCTLTATGGVTAVAVSNGGAYYERTPTVALTGGGGSGATATALLAATTLANLQVNNAGSGYNNRLAAVLTGGGGAGAAGLAVINGSGQITAVVPIALGSGYTTAPTVTLAYTGTGSGGSGATVTANISGGQVTSYTVTAAGSGYLPSPVVSITGGGGSGAQVELACDGNIYGFYIINAGSGYTGTPSVTVTGGAGSGAALTAVLAYTTVASITVTAPGSGYTAAPAVTFTNGAILTSETPATAAATLGYGVASVTVSVAGSGYTSAPTVGFTGGGGGSGAAATASIAGVAITGFTLTAPGSGYTGVPTVALSGGGGSGAAGVASLVGTTVASVTVAPSGSGYTAAPAVGFIGGGGSGATATAALAATSVASLALMSGGSGYTSAPTVGFTGGGGTGAGATATVGTSTITAVTITAAGSGYTSAPTVGFTGGGGTGATAVAPAGGTVSLVSAKIRKEAGYDVYDYTWALGIGVVLTRQEQREGGLRLETWVSLGQTYDAATMKPPGILMLKETEALDGMNRFTVSCMQSATGGADPTSGLALSLAQKHPFTYPGRAKAFSTSFAAVGFTATAYDVFRAPPATVLVDATMEVSYQTSSALAAPANALWNPDSWATVRAVWESWNESAKSFVKEYEGYRAVGSAATWTAGTGYASGFDTSCLGVPVYGGSSGSITVSGGPAAPDGNTYTLAINLDPRPAFTADDGTKYYRKTVIYATIPTQTALPV